MEDSPALRSILKSQYHASLAMLRETIEKCPEDVWLDRQPVNAFWQVAYHALFFTQLHLLPNAEAYRPWSEHHQSAVQHPDGIPGRVDPVRYKISKLEHQFVSLRHIQHHTAQLADRLRAARNIGIRWVGFHAK